MKAEAYSESGICGVIPYGENVKTYAARETSVGMLWKPKGLRLIEPAPAPEFFVSGIGRIDALPGGNVRFLLYADQSIAEDPTGELHHVVVLRVVRNMTGLEDSLHAMQDLARRAGDGGIRVCG